MKNDDIKKAEYELLALNEKAYRTLVDEVIALLKNSNIITFVSVGGQQISCATGTIPDKEPFRSFCCKPHVDIGKFQLSSTEISWLDSNVSFLLPVGKTRISEDVNRIHDKRIDIWLDDLVPKMVVGIFVDKKKE